MAKKSYPKVRTPAGVLAYGYIHKPDTQGKYADNKYKGDLIVDADHPDLADIKAKCDVAAEKEWGKVPDDLQYPLKDGTEMADAAKKKYKNDPDKHKEEFRGKTLIRAKSKYAPGVVDAKRQELEDGVEARSGDLVKFSAICYPYTKTEKIKVGKKIEEVEVFGVSLQLRNVQLLEKRNGGGNAADDFDDEDEYDTPTYNKKASDDDEDDSDVDPDDF